MGLNDLTLTYKDIGVIVAELVLIIIIFILTNQFITLIFRRLHTIPFLQKYLGDTKKAERNLKATTLLLSIVLAIASIAFNGYLLYQQTPIFNYTLAMMNTISPDFWLQFGSGLLLILLLFFVTKFIVPRVQRLLRRVQEWAKSYEQIKANNESLETFFDALNNILETGIWLFILALSMTILPLPLTIGEFFFVILRVYLIIALGRLLATAVTIVVDSIDELGQRYTKETSLQQFFERLRSLVPLLRRTLEYSIYVTTATLAIRQINFIAHFADYGPIIIQIIGIIFLSKVFIELSTLLVDLFLLKRDKHLTDIGWQQRITLAPLAKSISKYVIFFAAFLLILRALNVNIAPILAAVGGIGLIVGLGAQPIINDLISGAFILFENLYLVGDYIETGEASGIVEAIDVRTTRLRDPDGQLHIIRNGQLGDIVNFSKGYIYAVVEVGIAYDSDLDHIYRIIQETGEQLKEDNKDVLEGTIVEGLAEFDESKLLVHTITKSKPGRHREVGYELRKMLKEAFDRQGIEIPFTRRVLSFKPEDQKSIEKMQAALASQPDEETEA